MRGGGIGCPNKRTLQTAARSHVSPLAGSARSQNRSAGRRRIRTAGMSQSPPPSRCNYRMPRLRARAHRDVTAARWTPRGHHDQSHTDNREAALHKSLYFTEKLERAKGFEPSTPTLARLCSTTELHPRPCRFATRLLLAQSDRVCKMRWRVLFVRLRGQGAGAGSSLITKADGTCLKCAPSCTSMKRPSASDVQAVD